MSTEPSAARTAISDRVRLRPDALEWREVEGEVVALDLRRSTYLVINRSGTALWPALVEGTTRDHMVAQLSQEFGLKPATAAADVDAFIAMLADNDLLEV